MCVSSDHGLMVSPDRDQLRRRLAASLRVGKSEQCPRNSNVVHQSFHKGEFGIERRVLTKNPGEMSGDRRVAAQQLHRLAAVLGLEDPHMTTDREFLDVCSWSDSPSSTPLERRRAERGRTLERQARPRI